MDTENLRRWRLILGANGSDGTSFSLNKEDQRIDKVLEALYNSDNKDKYASRGSRGASLSSSAPVVSRWLGDIRELFSKSVVQVMQKDAVERLGINSLLTEKEMLETITPDVHMVATLMSLSKAIPEQNKEIARNVIRQVVEDLKKKLSSPMEQAITGALNRSIRKRNPRFKDINWSLTIQKNLKNYQPDYKTIIPEIRIGYGRKGQSLKDIILCLDQSGSMGESVIYSGIFGSVMASIPAVTTKMVVFDTEVVDLSEDLQDPVDLLFGVQLGGGTDIAKALGYCKNIISRPNDTVMVLITDLYEGGDQNKMRSRFKSIVESGVNLIVLLALDDSGAPIHHDNNAKFLANLGVPCFACTPDLFPDLMAAALQGQDISMWASQNIQSTTKNK